MTRLTGEAEDPLAVQGEIAAGEDGGVHVFVVHLDEVSRGSKQVHAAGDGGEDELVRGAGIERGMALPGDGDAVEQELHFGVLRGVNEDLPVAQRAGEQIGPGFADGDGAALIGEREGDGVLRCTAAALDGGAEIRGRRDRGGRERDSRPGGRGSLSRGLAAAGREKARKQSNRQDDSKSACSFHSLPR